jgi:hypothetical protein
VFKWCSQVPLWSVIPPFCAHCVPNVPFDERLEPERLHHVGRVLADLPPGRGESTRGSIGRGRWHGSTMRTMIAPTSGLRPEPDDAPGQHRSRDRLTNRARAQLP